MNMTKIISVVVTALAGLLMSITTLAHHSYANFDMSKEVPMTMTVKKFAWGNPHTWIYGTVKNADGTEAEWSLETRSPNELARQGLRSVDIKPGDTIKLDVYLEKGDTRVANVLRGTTAGGKQWGRTRGDLPGATKGGPPADAP